MISEINSKYPLRNETLNNKFKAHKMYIILSLNIIPKIPDNITKQQNIFEVGSRNVAHLVECLLSLYV